MKKIFAFILLLLFCTYPFLYHAAQGPYREFDKYPVLFYATFVGYPLVLMLGLMFLAFRIKSMIVRILAIALIIIIPIACTVSGVAPVAWYLVLWELFEGF